MNARPDMIKEINYFAKNPFKNFEPLKIDHLLDFTIIDYNGYIEY